MYYSSSQSLQVYQDAYRPTLPWDTLSESPCRSCQYRKMDKNKCKFNPDCPINIPTILPPDQPLPKQSEKYKNKICKFPGCKKPCSGDYCNGKKGHEQLMYARKRRYPDNPEYWHLPVVKGGRNNFLAKRIEKDKI